MALGTRMRSDIQFKFSEINVHEVFHQNRQVLIILQQGNALKMSAETISPSLMWIFNLSIKTCIYVEECKKAWVLYRLDRTV